MFFAQESQVWEITGAEFTQTETHTADGISVRFPRVTRIRDDKTWEQATSLPELRVRPRPARPLHGGPAPAPARR